MTFSESYEAGLLQKCLAFPVNMHRIGLTKQVRIYSQVSVLRMALYNVSRHHSTKPHSTQKSVGLFSTLYFYWIFCFMFAHFVIYICHYELLFPILESRFASYKLMFNVFFNYHIFLIGSKTNQWIHQVAREHGCCYSRISDYKINCSLVHYGNKENGDIAYILACCMPYILLPKSSSWGFEVSTPLVLLFAFLPEIRVL